MKNTNEMKILLEGFNTFLNEASEGEVLTLPGDSVYEYKRENDKWHTRRQGSNSGWTELASSQVLDDQFPELASDDSLLPNSPFIEPPDISSSSEEESLWDRMFGSDDNSSDSEEVPFWDRMFGSDDNSVDDETHPQEFSDGDIVLYPGETEYEYKREGGVWHTRKTGSVDTAWIALTSLRFADTVQKLNDKFLGNEQLTAEPNVSEQDSNIHVHPSIIRDGEKINSDVLDEFNEGKESLIRTCSIEQCAQYVSSMLPSSLSGNAWHRYRPSNMSITDLSDLSNEDVTEIEALFNDMNKAPSTGGSFESRAKQIIKNKLGDQGKYSDIDIGSVVGLYYDKSSNFAKAFYEGITGRKNMGTGENQRGSSIVGWTSDRIEDESFVGELGANSIGNGFGMNTHVGFVGLKLQNGEPVIVHNVHGSVYGTPLSAMSNDKLSIVWVDPTTVTAPVMAESKKNYRAGSLLTESLNDAAKQGLIGVSAVQEQVKNFLRLPDYETVDLLVAAALSISSRESGMGTGLSYRYSPRFSNLTQTLASRLGIADPSIGPTQIKFSNVNQSSELANYARRFGITNPSDLSDWTKALLATVGMLANMYEEAKRLQYNTTSSGINNCCSWTSTGNAALDLALVGYNSGPGKVVNYCGDGTTKTICDSGEIVLNYIPKYGSSRGSNTLLYVSGVARKLAEISSEVTEVMSAGRQQADSTRTSSEPTT